MGLIQQAEEDLSFTLENIDDFGVELKFIDEYENEFEVVGNSSDIEFLFDPNTGAAVIGRQCHVVVRISSLTDLGAGYPKTTWKCIYTDTNGNEWQTGIAEAPSSDRTLGIYNISLEAMEIE
jgi:hypothetical protein